MHNKGIHADPTKIQAIRDLSHPTSLRQLQSLLGKVNYIRQFIPNLSSKILPMIVLLKKESWYEWNKDCQKALEELKDDLLRSPTLLAPIPGQPFVLYISHIEVALAAYLAQANELWRECPIYYLSRTMNSAEQRHSRVGKACLALVLATQKLRHP